LVLRIQEPGSSGSDATTAVSGVRGVECPFRRPIRSMAVALGFRQLIRQLAGHSPFQAGADLNGGAGFRGLCAVLTGRQKRVLDGV
jgi:hypothetical protein